MAEATPASSKGAESRERTAYHVLKQTNAKDAIPTFRFAARNLQAANAEAAIRLFVEGKAVTTEARNTDDDNAGTYIAVPARSWNPVTVTVETKTVLKLT